MPGWNSPGKGVKTIGANRPGGESYRITGHWMGN